ncbi:hypothetical protein Nmel_008563 [Mimus melanotis]
MSTLTLFFCSVFSSPESCCIM